MMIMSTTQIKIYSFPPSLNIQLISTHQSHIIHSSAFSYTANERGLQIHLHQALVPKILALLLLLLTTIILMINDIIMNHTPCDYIFVYVFIIDALTLTFHCLVYFMSIIDSFPHYLNILIWDENLTTTQQQPVIIFNSSQLIQKNLTKECSSKQ